MSTASAPSQFLGIAALALNSILQPAGRICGGTDLPALRLSPPFQIANALSLICDSIRLTFAMDMPFREAVGVVAQRARLYHNRSGLREPERHFFFRVLVFIFCGLPAFLKAMAIQGDLVSYWLALSFFVPFVILEAIERLLKRSTSSRFAEAATFLAIGDANTLSEQVVIWPALATHVFYCLEAMNLALMNIIIEAKPFKMHNFSDQICPAKRLYGHVDADKLYLGSYR
ncbi:MAG: hypothetical protein L6R41_002906 [Letrouitia leprolyta]|nr:MAG: hypothetical protein L6R41_002906 [Letrouitia leprolyta]